MALVGHDVEIHVTGTKESQILDPDEVYIIKFTKDEPLRKDLADINALIENALETAFYNGDYIACLKVDGKNIVKTTIEKILLENRNNPDDVLPEVCTLPFLSNADPSDVYELICAVSSPVIRE